LVELGVLTRVDTACFAVYCQALGRAEQAERILAETGGAFTVRGPRGGEVANPLLRIARDAANEAMRLGAEFGCTPILRARLPGVDRPQPSKFGDLIS
jgi:P27 family predicted phage terminase small subunit